MHILWYCSVVYKDIASMTKLQLVAIDEDAIRLLQRIIGERARHVSAGLQIAIVSRVASSASYIGSVLSYRVIQHAP